METTLIATKRKIRETKWFGYLVGCDLMIKGMHFAHSRLLIHARNVWKKFKDIILT